MLGGVPTPRVIIMRCVCCGYEPTADEYAEQPYACAKCEPESFLPSIRAQLKTSAARLAESVHRRFSRATLKAK